MQGHIIEHFAGVIAGHLETYNRLIGIGKGFITSCENLTPIADYNLDATDVNEELEDAVLEEKFAMFIRPFLR